MIVKEFDHGLGSEWPLKILEKDIVRQYLAPLASDTIPTVLINSTWYSQYHHSKVLRWLRDNHWERLVLISMIDKPMPNRDWFVEFDKPVFEVGYYTGDDYIPFWVLVVNKWIEKYQQGPVGEIDTAFMCLNRKPHWHRKRLFEELDSAKLLDSGLVSMGSDRTGPALRSITENVQDSYHAPNGQREHHGIPNDIVSLGDITNWKKHFLNVVTETVFDVNRDNFVSEKIFKPIVGLRPFILYDAGGACAWLEKHGFQSYHRDFDDITDLDLTRPECLVPFLKVLCQQPKIYLQNKYIDLQPKMLYNRNRFDQLVVETEQKILKGIICQI